MSELQYKFLAGFEMDTCKLKSLLDSSLRGGGVAAVRQWLQPKHPAKTFELRWFYYTCEDRHSLWF